MDWKKIPDFTSYEASRCGLIRTHNWKNSGKTKIMKPAINKDGYLRTVLIRNDGKYCSIKVHRIIAITFLGKSNLETVNHKNGVKKDNRVENLEWMSRSDNVKHSFEMGLQPPRHGELNGCNKVLSSDVMEIRRIAKEKGRFYGRKNLANKYGVSESAIKSIVQRKTWKHI